MSLPRLNLATTALLIIAVLVGTMIAMGLRGHLPTWLIGLAMVL